jgi:uncharacterized protein (TIGR00730 family)
MNSFKKLCVFCGSSFGVNDVYKEGAIALGKILAARNIELVYGGGNVGLMGELARTVLENNGRVTGVIPKKIHENVQHVELSELIVVENMHERKAMMYDLADAFIALPGGIGTLEELAEVMTWYQIGYHYKPIGILNTNEFYNNLQFMLSHMVAEGFLKTEFIDKIVTDEQPASLVEKMLQQEMNYIDKWSS